LKTPSRRRIPRRRERRPDYRADWANNSNVTLRRLHRLGCSGDAAQLKQGIENAQLAQAQFRICFLVHIHHSRFGMAKISAGSYLASTTIANSGRQRRICMAKFIVEPHFRLQEWVAQEKGYFRDQGLDYEFRELIRSTEGQHHNKGGRGAFQSIEQGREAHVSCACHWTVNVAASNGHTKLFADLYSVAPSGIFVAADSSVRTPADLAGVPISVGFQSGSHYSTIQALEQYMPAGEINLIFEDGMLFSRMERLIDGNSPAAALFNGPYYLAEQLGFRKVIDTTFMISAMIKGSPDPEDIRRYFRALRSAQRDIDLRPELYTHYYRNEFPDRFHAMMDTRRWGPGERIVFEPYSKEVFEQSFDWIAKHKIFSDGAMGSGDYDRSTISFAAE
jgi:ABC-type nitrate/sulfonate/bicarbonate transport system substrate-binding protein